MCFRVPLFECINAHVSLLFVHTRGCVCVSVHANVCVCVCVRVCVCLCVKSAGLSLPSLSLERRLHELLGSTSNPQRVDVVPAVY